MAITGISHKVQSTLTLIEGSEGDLATRELVQELGAELLELAEAAERLSAEVDRLIDGRWGSGPPRS